MIRPVKKAWRKQCWWCTHPGVEPPPCKVCGGPGYFFNGYCEPCHPSRAQLPKSCQQCLSWGILGGRVCTACYQFAHRNPTGICGSCGSERPLASGYCRLCTSQARLYAGHDDHGSIEAFLRLAANGQQLFLADMIRSVRLRIPPAPGWRRPPVTLPAEQPPAGHQLVLFPAARDFTRFDREHREHRDLDNPQVILARRVAETFAELRGWPPFTHKGVDRGLIILLSQLPPGVPVPFSDAVQLADRSVSVERVIEVLQELDLFHDDRADALQLWFRDKISSLPAAMRDELETWFEILCGRTPRTRPRDPQTIQSYVRYFLPLLQAWSTNYQSLRQITRGDAKTAFAQLTGSHRGRVMRACRSLFSVLKKQRVIFQNPMPRLSGGTIQATVPALLRDDDLVATAKAATGPERRLLFLLAAGQALRPVQIRRLHLTDVDLGGRRITIEGHTRPLDDVTARALETYLRHRRARWPRSANPHLLVSQQTTYEDGPVSSWWIKSRWKGMSVTLDRLRKDRQVDELIAVGPDPLHFMAVFGTSATTATTYAAAVAEMLAQE